MGTADLDELLEHVEGWPAILELALQAGAVRPIGPSVLELGGDDRLIADYLRDEVLAELDPAQFTFLMRTAILDRLDGDLCDAVLDRPGSGVALRDLERTNFLVVPLDHTGHGAYRHHPTAPRLPS